MTNHVIKASNLVKVYPKGLRALDDISMAVYKKEVLVIMGPSGSGKSTLIRTFNGLEAFNSGKLEVVGIPLDSAYNERNVREIRKRVGMVFQQFNLFPHLSILENITLAPIQVQKCKRIEAEEDAIHLLEQMGIAQQAMKYPSQLSGGEQQRVAIARSLALKPDLLLFDEPTSALDPERVHEVLDVMRTLAGNGMTMVVVTHEISFAKEVADRVLFMDSGKVIETSTPDTFFSNARHQRSRKFLNQIEK
ncbi:amino acid ABC transporter ATP-binding protein [Prochlorococcus marinus]|uniref:ABC-type polar amino acid transport system, ATPase component n=1 Tax=Prochlorococcus marinus (strain MIT 9211) TaxID=93059 RepID=A9BC45_PROM4|nr:amino acid ABC transporter ATP-binding protein [Prochlorococcus marinus]ABX09407.1 ABC-type polar amino acid transport system, ATPase component [Prochlorococcus marinus str. MIT 9211]